MNEIENLGNLELSKCFLSLKLNVYHAFKIDGISNEEYNQDPRTNYDKKYLSNDFFNDKNDLYLRMLKEADKTHLSIFGIEDLPEASKQDLALYMLLKQEIIRRGFKIDDDDLLYKMALTPTYIREIAPTNYPGDMPIYRSSTQESVNIFDYPVRKACEILTEKGYHTYWSSANIDDYKERKGHVIKDKNVAYILINPNNLTEKLKSELILDGKCNFWGIARLYEDNGKYYGIWAEITSENMRCDDLSDILSKKALTLPDLEKDIISKNKR